MVSSPNHDNRDSGLKQKILQHLKSANVPGRIKEMVAQVYENALAQENAVLSRPERQKLFEQITRQILNDMLDESYGYNPSKS